MSFTESLADLIGSKIKLQDENMRLREALRQIRDNREQPWPVAWAWKIANEALEK